jgi:uncharacterized protein (DUF2062 family)
LTDDKLKPNEPEGTSDCRPVRLSLRQKFRAAYRKLLASPPATPFQIAASVGLGICMGIVPIWGYQMLAAALLAHLLRLNKVIAVLASNISIPIMIPLILYASLLCGRLVINGHLDYSLQLSEIDLEMAWEMLSEYLVGSLILAVAAGLTGGGLTYLIARGLRFIRTKRVKS